MLFVMLAIPFPFLSVIKIWTESVGFVLKGFDILVKSTVASKSGLMYVSQPFVRVTVLVEVSIE